MQTLPQKAYIIQKNYIFLNIEFLLKKTHFTFVLVK